MKRNGTPRRDIYAETTAKIVAALEDGVAPWVRPWRTLGASGELRNGASGHAYGGVNTLLLRTDFSLQQELLEGRTPEARIWRQEYQDPRFAVWVRIDPISPPRR